MKRLLACLLALLLCAAMTACGEEPAAPIPEEPAVTTEFDDAINNFLSLYWQASPDAVDDAAPDALYTHLQKEGYGDKAAVKAYVEQEQAAIQTNHFGEEIASFSFSLVEHEQYNDENTATVTQKLSLDYGIDKSTVSAAHTVLLDSVGTTTSGALIPVDAISVTIVTIDGKHYIVEAFDLINDYAYQQWLD